MTNKNSPSVTMVIGRVNNTSTGFTSAFIKPMTTTAKRADGKSVTTNPGKIRETAYRATAFSNQFTISRILSFLLYIQKSGGQRSNLF